VGESLLARVTFCKKIKKVGSVRPKKDSSSLLFSRTELKEQQNRVTLSHSIIKTTNLPKTLTIINTRKQLKIMRVRETTRAYSGRAYPKYPTSTITEPN